VVHPAASLQHRDHRKLVVVDGGVAFLGGINISRVYGSVSGSSRGRRSPESTDEPFENRPWRDLQIRLEGPAVADVQRGFIKQWSGVKKETLDDPSFFPQPKRAGTEIVRIMEASPAQGVNPLYVTLIFAIESAETEVVIMNSYFVPHPQLQKALEDAARRGVDVKLILPGRSDNALVYHAGRSYYDDLLEAGVKIYERRTRMLHAKSAMVDGVWSTIGSTNLDWRSLAYNDELNAVVLGPDFAKSIGAVFEKDIADSDLITLENWRHRPITDRIKESAARAWAQAL
jgi:cardiolipin synthase A/B